MLLTHRDFDTRGVPLNDFDRLLEKLDAPHKQLPTLLVGGTNGKGTVATSAAALLTRLGRKTGLFTSPHIIAENERIAIDGVCITDKALAHCEQRLAQLCAPQTLSFFQYLTLLGYLHFQQEQVDCVVLEVGLGGRLDPTNRGTPKVSVLVSIDLDHTELLGNTRREILLEKLPIGRRGAPLIFGEQSPELVKQARDWAQQHGVDLQPVAAAPIPQKQNHAVALAAVSAFIGQSVVLSDADVAACFAKVCLPARWQPVDNFIVDLAHNDAALCAIATRLSEKTSVIIAKPANRAWTKGLRAVAAKAESLICPQVDYKERDVTGALQPYFTPADNLRMTLLPMNAATRSCESLGAALKLCSNKKTVICGSARLAGEALRLLRVDTFPTRLYS